MIDHEALFRVLFMLLINAPIAILSIGTLVLISIACIRVHENGKDLSAPTNTPSH